MVLSLYNIDIYKVRYGDYYYMKPCASLEEAVKLCKAIRKFDNSSIALPMEPVRVTPTDEVFLPMITEGQPLASFLDLANNKYGMFKFVKNKLLDVGYNLKGMRKGPKERKQKNVSSISERYRNLLRQMLSVVLELRDNHLIANIGGPTMFICSNQKKEIARICLTDIDMRDTSSDVSDVWESVRETVKYINMRCDIPNDLVCDLLDILNPAIQNNVVQNQQSKLRVMERFDALSVMFTEENNIAFIKGIVDHTSKTLLDSNEVGIEQGWEGNLKIFKNVRLLIEINDEKNTNIRRTTDASDCIALMRHTLVHFHNYKNLLKISKSKEPTRISTAAELMSIYMILYPKMIPRLREWAWRRKLQL